MCFSLSGFSASATLIAAASVIVGHLWFYYLNRDIPDPVVNLFGYRYKNASISDIYACSIIWISCLYCIYWISSCCQSVCSEDSKSTEIRQLKQDNIQLHTKVTNLTQQLRILQEVTKRIELMVPYDLNTLVEKKMYEHIPQTMYSPMRGARFNNDGVRVSGRPSSIVRSARNSELLCGSPRPPSPHKISLLSNSSGEPARRSSL